MNKDFISQILEKIGYVSAFAVAFSQYFLRDSFASFFKDQVNMYSVSSNVALILSVLVIISVFSNRYVISMKIYFSKKKKDQYFASFRQTADQPTKYVAEPRSFTLKNIAFIFIFLAVASFYGFIFFDPILAKSIFYIFFIVIVVASISIYATSLYLENDWQRREKEKKELVMNKLKEHFAGDIQIPTLWIDNSNIVQPIKRMVVVRGGKKFNVAIDASDPDKYFVIDEIIQ